jgi:hypothetical protein
MEIATPPRDHIPRGGVVSFSGAPPVRRELAGLCHKRRVAPRFGAAAFQHGQGSHLFSKDYRFCQLCSRQGTA